MVEIGCGPELRKEIISGDFEDNSAADMLSRTSGYRIMTSANITGTGAVSANVLQLTGTVLIISQWAEIKSITTLTNMTNVYASLYDGTNSVNLTADGLDLSSATVGSFFTKDQVASQTYSASIADQARLLETIDAKKAGRPFTVTQKNGADTFIRFNFTTTDNPVDIDMDIYFEFVPMNGGTLVFL